MKNIFKKTAGVMLASSMLLAVMATGCGQESSNTDTKNTDATNTVASSTTSSADDKSTVESSTTSSASADLELAQQTLVDSVTGVEVTGMLPVGAKVLVTADVLSTVDLYDRFDSPYSLEGDFPRFTSPIGDYEAYQTDRKTTNIAKIMNNKGWTEWEGTAGGMIFTEVYIVKDSEILDFKSESDLIVTMPFNYRRGLVTGGITDEAVVKQYDYDKKEFVDIEIVPAEDTAKGMFQFKIKNSGIFFMGGESNIDGLMDFYDDHYE